MGEAAELRVSSNCKLVVDKSLPEKTISAPLEAAGMEKASYGPEAASASCDAIENVVTQVLKLVNPDWMRAFRMQDRGLEEKPLQKLKVRTKDLGDPVEK